MTHQKTHEYRMNLTWTGNRGTGTTGYRDYSRDHEITAPGKSVILPGSSDPAFRGDRGTIQSRRTAPRLLSSCHMLWFLHLCADAGIVVTGYTDTPEGTMIEHPDGSGEFTSVTLHPAITLATQSADRAAHLDAIHHRAHELCYIARSVNFLVTISAVPVRIVESQNRFGPAPPHNGQLLPTNEWLIEFSIKHPASPRHGTQTHRWRPEFSARSLAANNPSAIHVASERNKSESISRRHVQIITASISAEKDLNYNYENPFCSGRSVVACHRP